MAKNIKYYMIAKKDSVRNVVLPGNSKSSLVLLKMLNSLTKIYTSFILTLKTLLALLTMPDSLQS